VYVDDEMLTKPANVSEMTERGAICDDDNECISGYNGLVAANDIGILQEDALDRDEQGSHEREPAAENAEIELPEVDASLHGDEILDVEVEKEEVVNGSNSLLKPDVENELKYGQDTAVENNLGNININDDYIDGDDEQDGGQKRNDGTKQYEETEDEVAVATEDKENQQAKGNEVKVVDKSREETGEEKEKEDEEKEEEEEKELDRTERGQTEESAEVELPRVDTNLHGDEILRLDDHNEAMLNGSNSLLKPDVENELKYGQDTAAGNNFGSVDMDDDDNDGKNYVNEGNGGEKPGDKKEDKVAVALAKDDEKDEQAKEKKVNVKEKGEENTEEQEKEDDDDDADDDDDDDDDVFGRNSFNFKTMNWTDTEADKTKPTTTVKNSIETGINADVVEKYGQERGTAGNDFRNVDTDVDGINGDDERDDGKGDDGTKQDKDKESEVIVADREDEQAEKSEENGKGNEGENVEEKETEDDENYDDDDEEKQDASNRNSFHFRTANRTEADKTRPTTTAKNSIETGVNADVVEKYDFDNNKFIVEASDNSATDNATKTSANNNVVHENLFNHDEDPEVTDSSLPIPSDDNEVNNLIRQHTDYTGKQHSIYKTILFFVMYY